MSEAEKEANDLIEKYKRILCVMGKSSEAKQCALVCVDKILEALPMYTGNLNHKWEHYNKVKEIITNK